MERTHQFARPTPELMRHATEEDAAATSCGSASSGSDESSSDEESEDEGKSNDLRAVASSDWLDNAQWMIAQGFSVQYIIDTSGNTALHAAAQGGHVALIAELLLAGAEIDAHNYDGETALEVAACMGQLAVVQELIKRGAAVNIADKYGVTPLLCIASMCGVAMVRELITHGANVCERDIRGRSVLHYAALRGNYDVVAELISSGAEPAAKTNSGETALSIAVARSHRLFVRELLLATVLKGDACSTRCVELFVVATMGDLRAVETLIEQGESVDAMSIDGRTPLFYALGFGHMDVVKMLVKRGASVAIQSLPSDLSRGGETPLTLVGRAGCMEIFEEIIKAGAPVNVRCHETGETPLISAARWDFIAGVQLLLSSGGALRVENGCADSEVFPLIPGTLKTMQSLCAATIEFQSICMRVVKRLQTVCYQLQARNPESIQEGALVTFANILFRVCRLQLEIEKRETPLWRFLGSRAVASKIYDFHEELDHFADLMGLGSSPTGIYTITWKAQWGDDQILLSELFEKKLADDDTLMRDCVKTKKKLEVAILLESELVAYAREGKVKLQDIVRGVRDRFLKLGRLEAPVLPAWFISREDVEMHSWKIVLSNSHTTHYDGEWRKTSVRIETGSDSVDKSASRWFELSHPNVVKLFGACNLGKPVFIVCEFMRDERSLHDVLRDIEEDQNRRGTTWKCLHQAALGLRYVHNRGLAHGNIRPRSILVGTNLVTKLSGLHKDSSQYSYQPGDANWVARELFEYGALPSAASDIYAFGMCIWEALTGELPWKGMRDSAIYPAARKGRLPERPSTMTDDEWDLITKMCQRDPNERVGVDFVVNRLEKFDFECELHNKLNDTQHSSTDNKVWSSSRGVSEYLFSELNGSTIPETLKRMASKCKRLPEEDQWLSQSVLPALVFIFDLLQQQQKTASDIEVVQFCLMLTHFQRHLRIAVSENSTRLYARSRKVAESNSVVYAELDRLLDILEVSADDSIRCWNHNLVVTQYDSAELDVSSNHVGSEASSDGDVSVVYFDSVFTNHQLWTRAGLATTPQCSPPWTLPLKDVVFKESDQIGRGAFGEVFKGSWLGTTVVIKFMGYEEDEDTIPTDLLLHEVRVWHHLSHPHVMRLYGACHRDKRYFVMEYASGGDLLAFLKRPGNEKLQWQKLYETALGLQYLHGQNVAHNDLKCDNIVVGMDGNAKLIDFGLSALLNEAEIRIEKKAIGAVHWRSPEYLAGGRPSLASDVYSFAMCIIEVISGDIPWGRSILSTGVKFQVKKGRIPNLPDSMNDKQRNLIKLMTKRESSERVRMGFIVNKLSEIVRDESFEEAAL